MAGKNKISLPNVALEVTSRCNLDCKYCYNIWKRPGAAPAARSSYGRAIAALKRLFRLAEVKQVTLTGGEPFLFERLPEVALCARMKGAAVAVISNGTVGSAESYAQLMELGVRLFELPLHAPEPGPHDRITGVVGSWTRSRRSIEQLLELGAEAVAVIVLTREACGGVVETLALLQQLGVRRVMINRFNVGGRGIAEAERIAPSRAELRRAFREADAFASRSELTITSNVCAPICLLDPADYPRLRFGSCAADPRRMPLTLDLDGNLRLCNHSPVVAGNIFRQPLEQIFDASYARGWRDTTPERCAGCAALARCRGGCRAAAEQLGRSLSVDPAADLANAPMEVCR